MLQVSFKTWTIKHILETGRVCQRSKGTTEHHDRSGRRDRGVLCDISGLSGELRHSARIVGWLAGWFYWRFTTLQRYFSHVAIWKQEITNLLKFKWRGRESNPGPFAPQAKSLTTTPHHCSRSDRTSVCFFVCDILSCLQLKNLRLQEIKVTDLTDWCSSL